MQKNETGLLSSAIHKNHIKLDIRLQCMTQNHKTARKKHRYKLNIGLSNIYIFRHQKQRKQNINK